jgi:hyperosmotically inducible protein
MTKKFLKHLALPALIIFAQGASGQNPGADNTRNNQQDRAQSAPTADQQSNGAADLDISKRIRRSVTADRALTTYAHNVKIITRDGMVTLKGVVHTDDEKTAIGAKAAQVVGADHVSNQLTIAASK